jgi:hypothetical protein
MRLRHDVVACGDVIMRMWGSIANERFPMTSIRVSMMYLGAADVRSVDLT